MLPDTNAITLNRYAYANGNPVSNVDPFGLAVEERGNNTNQSSQTFTIDIQKFLDEYFVGKTTAEVFVNDDMRKALHEALKHAIKTAPRPNNIAPGTWAKQVQKDLQWADDILGPSSKFAKGLKYAPAAGVVLDIFVGINENVQNGENNQEILTDILVDAGFGALGAGASAVGTSLATYIATSALAGTAIGTAVPGLGNVIGAVGGVVAGIIVYGLTESVKIKGKSAAEWADEGIDWIADKFISWFN